MKRIRGRLTYANVISTLALFLVLGGGAAIAATELEPNSVATVHIQPQAVTGVKIKSGAVISSRLADEAVTEGKIADGSVTAAKLDPGLPFSRVVERIRSTEDVPFPASNGVDVPYPIENPTFTQPAGETHQYIGSFQVHFPATCGSRRDADVALRIDPGPRPFEPGALVGLGNILDDGFADEVLTGHFVPVARSRIATAAPLSPTSHTFSVTLEGASCGGFADPGGTSMRGVQIEVIGTR